MLIKNLTNKREILNNDSNVAWVFTPHEIKEVNEGQIDRFHLATQIDRFNLKIIPEKEISRFELMDL